MPEGSGALSFIGKNLASGAVSYAGGRIGGWALGGIFGGIFDSGPSPQEMMDKMKEILGAVQALGKQLEGITNTLHSMQTYIASNFREIEKQLTEISQHQLYQTWQQTDNQITAYLNQIETQHNTYVEYALAADSTSKDEVTELVHEISNTTNGAKVSLDGISKFVVGDGQQKGVLQLWSEMIAPLLQSGRLDYGTVLEDYLAYYTKILYGQMCAINLVMEAHNQRKNNAVAKKEYDRYRRELMKSQEIPFLRSLEQLAFDAMHAGGSWLRDSNGGDSVLIKLECYTVTQGISAGGYYRANYHPTRSRYLAEKLLAAAQALKPDERRIVVWMIEELAGGVGDLKGARIALAPADGGGDAVRPTSAENVLEKATFQFAGGTLTEYTHVCRRAIFTTLADGAYKLDSEMNNTYQPVPGARKAMRSFVDDLYLTHLLQVGPESQFDFMDFAAYPDPIEYAARVA